MASRITVFYKVPDARAEIKKKQFETIGFKGKIREVSLLDSYAIDAHLSAKELALVAQSLTNPILETFSINKIITPRNFDWLIEIGFLPGVTDNIGATTKETIADLLKREFKPEESVYSSQIFFIRGKLSRGNIEKIAYSLHNPLIQRARIETIAEYRKEGGLPILVPKVRLGTSAAVTKVDLNVSDEELTRIGKQGIQNNDGTSRGPLALDCASMKTIKSYFKSKGRFPTDVELESIAQTWSEHCKHTIFADPIDELKEGLYKSYIKEATRVIRKKKGKNDFCASVFTDNSGAIIFDKDHLVTHKVETHNSPSALDPFGGAITGIVGVNRDAMGFGMGAKPIANVYGFCFGSPNDTRPLYRDKARTQRMLSPRRIMNGVVQGVNVGGNCSGIPTAQGFAYFNDRFRGKPLVFVGTVGLIPKKIGAKHSSTEKRAKPGDYIVMVGGRVGQDGIHGATFSSESMDAGSPATAVQIGDPITQKKMSDAIIKEARDLGLYNSITDNGAGGLSCSVAEMARESNGCDVQLEKVPLKYPGLEPWKIWISESQERMTLAIPKNKWPKFKALMDRRGVEATVIGAFTDSGKCRVTYTGKSIMNIELGFLHDGLPVKYLMTKEEKVAYQKPPARINIDMNQMIIDMLKRPNITSYEFISNQYDYEVQASSVVKPLEGRGRVNGDIAVLRPIFGSKKGIVLSAALNPTYSEIDSYKMAASSIDGAIRAIVAAGATMDSIALLDNFCWCSSNDPVRLGQLKKAVKACYDYSTTYETPFISGKDSMFNDFKGFDEDGNPITISVPPTLLVSSIGVMEDVTKVVSTDFKFNRDLVYMLGDTYDECAGSEYFAHLSEKEKKEYAGSKVPGVNAKKNKKLYKAFGRCVEQELIASAISVGRGGVAIAVLKSAMAGKLGARLFLKAISALTSADDFTLFSESQGRLLVSIAPRHRKEFEKNMRGISCALIGKVTGTPRITIDGRKSKNIVDCDITRAIHAYKSTFKDY